MKINKDKLEKAAYIMKTIAHPTRLAVIQLLHTKGTLPVNEICSLLDCEQSLVSHHLSNMRVKGLLKAERKGTSILYSLKEKDLAKLVKVIENCKCNM
ncbi:MAG: transcriptional regulator [Bacteroidetes bacterium]|nr:MAG: transcriptional regulator [Bacteroidota bacterium]REK05729.1 MAG: transcriptional regulator [Bacteroidota bacterium]REK31965.1 MAG: transcriptional regulator [Bacteroidota bacterium]REK50030.1 MAG: transcriptional regulator [Bacteroidota bacterium]